MKTNVFFINSILGKIEISRTTPNQSLGEHIALCLHPNTEYGGNKDSKQIYTIASALAEMGIICIRPNLRGAGNSSGSYDEGVGELDDIETILDWMHKEYPHCLNLSLAGFSFGAYLVTKIYKKVKHYKLNRCILVGLPLNKFKHQDLHDNSLIIHGELDELTHMSEVLYYSGLQKQNVVVVPGADHLFNTKLDSLKNIIKYSYKL